MKTGIIKRLIMLSVFVTVSLFAFPEASSGSPEVSLAASENPISDAVLQKTVFSSNLRLVLAVGVEGTGHNYFCEVDDHLFDNNPGLPRLPSEDNLNAGRFHIRSSMGSTPQRYSTAIDVAKTAMRKLAQDGATLPSPGTVMIVHGLYSYPDGMGLHKALMYLDLRLLAEVAEAEGVDFRVVYLQRPAKDILVANTIHRGFQNTIGQTGKVYPEKRFMEYMQVMITDIAVVHSFLAEIDPAFVICHDFERAGEIEQSSSIANFLAPNPDVADLLDKSLRDVARVRGPSTEPLRYDGADVVAARLQRKLDSFESSICTAVH